MADLPRGAVQRHVNQKVTFPTFYGLVGISDVYLMVNNLQIGDIGCNHAIITVSCPVRNGIIPKIGLT
jgi:hypothetical protein